jgi:hypothetical protein
MIPPMGGAGDRSPGRQQRLRVDIPHCRPYPDRLAICAFTGLTGRIMSAISIRSAGNAGNWPPSGRGALAADHWE